MTSYKCFVCGKKISQESMGKRVRCIYCGAKLVYKPTTISRTWKAR